MKHSGQGRRAAGRVNRGPHGTVSGWASGVLGECVQAVADAQQAKQDEEWATRERARQKLMAEVDAIRQEQIREKQARQLAQLEEEMRYKMQIDKVGGAD